MSIRCKLEDADQFKKIVNAIKELCVDCNFECDENGIECQCMDNSHVALVSLSMKAAGFLSYECEDKLTLGLNLTNMAKILNCSNPGDSMTIEATDTETVKINFESKNEDRSSEFELKMYDIDTEHLGIPETEYKCDVSLPSSDFSRICRDLTTIGDSVTINAAKSGVQFEVTGDIGKANLCLRQQETADGKGVHVELAEPVCQQFALRYLTMFSKSSNISNRVTLSMSPEVPLQVDYQIADMGNIKFFLAPKIEED